MHRQAADVGKSDMQTRSAKRKRGTQARMPLAAPGHVATGSATSVQQRTPMRAAHSQRWTELRA